MAFLRGRYLSSRMVFPLQAFNSPSLSARPSFSQAALFSRSPLSPLSLPFQRSCPVSLMQSSFSAVMAICALLSGLLQPPSGFQGASVSRGLSHIQLFSITIPLPQFLFPLLSQSLSAFPSLRLLALAFLVSPRLIQAFLSFAMHLLLQNGHRIRWLRLSQSSWLIPPSGAGSQGRARGRL